jgi:hypothetical protein
MCRSPDRDAPGAGRRAGATTSTGPKEKIILPERQSGLRQCRKIRDWRMFKEMNFHFSSQSSNPIWPAMQSVSATCQRPPVFDEGFGPQVVAFMRRSLESNFFPFGNPVCKQALVGSKESLALRWAASKG